MIPNQKRQAMHDHNFQATPGTPYQLEPGLDVVLAPNPSPMTGPGTNTYILGRTTLAIIDPGPMDNDHLMALLAAIDGRPVSHIFVTHSHLDHSPLAKPLSDAVYAPVYAFGDSFAGRSDVMQSLSQSGLHGGGEGLDHDFAPDVIVSDGQQFSGPDWHVEVVHTPGHLGNHIALKWQDAVFVGDLVMGWSTSLVSPPDGDMTDFLKSCEKLLQMPARVHYSGHGAPILDPHQRLSDLIAHRQSRSAQIMEALATGPRTVVDIVDEIYVDLDGRLKTAAGRNVLAHLVDLYVKKLVAPVGSLSADVAFELRQKHVGANKIKKNK